MKHFVRSAPIFILSVVFLLLCASKVNAQEYKVKPILFISQGWENRYTEEYINNQYKTDIIQALEDVQAWYAQRLNGHTFNFEENVDVLYGQALGGSKPVDNTKDFLYYQSGDKLLPPQDGVIYSVWVIGSGNLTNTATADVGARFEGAIKERGYAILSHQSLKNLNAEERGFLRYMSLSSIAHELGHTFGLVRSGYARAHTCSKISEGDCSSGAPRPIPKAEECYNSVMCPIALDNFPNLNLNNSIHNPEFKKIFESPFINPQNDQLPDSQSQIDDVVPNPIRAGEAFTITGSGFGDTKGEVLIGNSSAKDVNYSINLTDYILDWKDNEIKLSVPKTFVTDMIQEQTVRSPSYLKNSYTNPFRLIVVPKNGISSEHWSTSYSEFTVTFEDSEITRHTITINASLTCGDQNQPIDRNVTLSDQYPNRNLSGYHPQPKQSGFPSKGPLVYTINPFFDNLTFYVYADSIYHQSDPSKDIHPEPDVYTINLNSFEESIQRDVTFHYPECPTIVSSDDGPTSSFASRLLGVGDISEEEDEGDEESGVAVEETPACEQSTFVGCGACGVDRFACADGSNVIELPNPEGDCGRPEINVSCEVPAEQSSESQSNGGSCEDVYYSDTNINEETNPTGCIHKYSSDSYPTCNYLFAPVYEPEKFERCVE